MLYESATGHNSGTLLCANLMVYFLSDLVQKIKLDLSRTYCLQLF